MVDIADELVTSFLDPATGPTLSTSWMGDSSLIIAWISGFEMMISCLGIRMFLSCLSEDEASTCSLSKAASHPLEK